eukprot:2733859-Alexandrium_andersonii.AAC.1
MEHPWPRVGGLPASSPSGRRPLGQPAPRTAGRMQRSRLQVQQRQCNGADSRGRQVQIEGN